MAGEFAGIYAARGGTMTTAEAGAAGDFAGIRALRSRQAGYSVARKCLEVQGDERQRLLPEAYSWYQGALGEIEVGRVLAQLGPEWLVLHSVPFGTADTDIDHLVIGPRGIFTLNTKHHRGKNVWVGDRRLLVGGVKTNHLGDSLGEAKRVGQRLYLKTKIVHRITPVLVIVGTTDIKDIRVRDNQRPAVIPVNHVLSWLRTHPITVAEQEAQLATLAAEEPDTWHVDPHAAESFRVMQRFERLQAAVGAKAMRPPVSRPTSAAPRTRPSRQPRPRSRRRSGAIEPLIRLGVTIAVGWFCYQWLMSYLAQQTL